ncbi:epithelial cell transforming sequence 2 oncoprotein-like [Entomophthora muscae]|uniref:Epithelial cell transforming sequence 2 oncoprotein-like n=1 Tax=Entomophthora muscae TaxID=34485 RepID=A0ACC2TX43_9FUNG|nr:epithelial cell transforming sequence 2 oncoprotein-like [Entomophthora muscae]
MLLPTETKTSVEAAEICAKEVAKYLKCFDEYLDHDFYRFNLTPADLKLLAPISELPESSPENDLSSSPNYEPTPYRPRKPNFNEFTNVNFSPILYPDSTLLNSYNKELKIFMGYDEDLGPMCLSIVTSERIHTVYIRSNWRTSKIALDASMLSPSSVPIPQVISSKAYSVIIYLALEKYLFELEEDWFRLLTWQQKINFSSPYNRDVYEKFEEDHPGYISDLKAAVTFSISAPQIAKEDLHRIVRQLEAVDDPTIKAPLFNIERKVAQRCIYTDIILHCSGLSRTMEQRDTYNILLQILGQMLANQGTCIDHEALLLPKIITEELTDTKKVRERRRMILEELIETERRYVQKLKAILKIFVIPFRELVAESKPIILPYDIKAVFNNIEEISLLNESFLNDLLGLDVSCKNLGEICEKNMAKFDVYHNYISGYNYSHEYTCSLERKNNAYFNFLMNARDHPECEKLALKDLIVMPVQRLPRYKILFTDYLRFTPKDHPEYSGLYKALVKVNEISNLAGQKLSETALELSNLLKAIDDCPAKILSSSRYLITQLDCVENDISTFTPQENITLYLLNDCLVITRRPKDQPFGRKAGHTFISWINLIGIEVMDPDIPGNSNGILIRGCLDFSEDLYWDHQEIHLFVALNSSDKERFYGELCKAIAVCRAKETGSSCLYQTVDGVTLFFFVYKPEDYRKSRYKNELSLQYREDLTEPPEDFYHTQNSSLVHGLILGTHSRFCLRMKSRIPYTSLDPFFSGPVEGHPPEEIQNPCMPSKFKALLFHNLVYRSFALRATPAYLHKQHLINRCMMESVFGLHFPSCKQAHPYLSSIKSFSRTIKDDRHVLISNGAAISNSHPKRNPLRQHNKHHLGTRKLEPFRDISKARSLTDPVPASPVKPKSVKTFYPVSIRARSSSSCSATTQLIPSHEIKDDAKPTDHPRKKKGSFSKMTRFFSWTK